MTPRVRKAKTPPSEPARPVIDYRFDTSHTNIPPAGWAGSAKAGQRPSIFEQRAKGDIR